MTSTCCWLWSTVKLLRIMISCLCKRLSLTHTYTHIQTHTRETKILWNNVILALCSNIFYYICYILVHTKDKMMVTSPKLISWSTDCTCSFQTWLLIVIPLDWASLVYVSITLGASLMFQVLTVEPIFQ